MIIIMHTIIIVLLQYNILIIQYLPATLSTSLRLRIDNLYYIFTVSNVDVLSTYMDTQ